MASLKCALYVGRLLSGKIHFQLWVFDFILNSSNQSQVDVFSGLRALAVTMISHLGNQRATVTDTCERQQLPWQRM